MSINNSVSVQAVAALEWASQGANTLNLRGKGAFPVRVVAPNGTFAASNSEVAQAMEGEFRLVPEKLHLQPHALHPTPYTLHLTP